VRTLVDANRPAGLTIDTWNGDDDDGKRLPAGVYVARLEAAGSTLDHRIVLVR
jgi:flagellar hook assembly protein FlgD